MMDHPGSIVGAIYHAHLRAVPLPVSDWRDLEKDIEATGNLYHVLDDGQFVTGETFRGYRGKALENELTY